MKMSEMGIGLNCDVMTSFLLLKYQISGDNLAHVTV